MSESVSKPIKTRWGLMIGIFLGVIVLPLAIILALAATHFNQEPVAPSTSTVNISKRFDYSKIVNVIGAGYLVREKMGNGEMWSNISMSSVIFINGIDNITNVMLVIPTSANEDVMFFNFYAVKQLAIIFADDESILEWVVNLINQKIEQEIKIFNGVEVEFTRLKIAKYPQIFLTFKAI